jgi:tRNA (guanine37-N1)-methyltransferase
MDEAREPLRIDIVTVFPNMLRGFLEESMLARAVKLGAVRFRFVNPRDFTTDPHRSTDDRPYGGGPGMVMLPGPLCDAVESVRDDDARVVFMTPSGKPFRQEDAGRLALARHLVFLCGHYEGIDERAREALADEEISIGDYVLTNGVLPAAVVIDAVVRLLPGVLGGGEDATRDESFQQGLLEPPQYTRPEVFRGRKVPEVLLGGNHQAIAAWRREQAELRTLERRPDLAAAAGLPRKEEPKKKRRARRPAPAPQQQCHLATETTEQNP